MTVEPARHDVDSLREAAGIVLENWRMEITGLVGEWWGRRLAPDPGMPCLLVSQREIEARHMGRALGHYRNIPEDAGRLATRLHDSGAIGDRNGDIVLRFDSPDVLRTQMRLPRTSRAALRGALGFELDRLCPIPQADLYFDFTVKNIDPSTNRIELESRALRRRSVDDAIEFAHRADLAVAGIILGDDTEPADWRRFPVDRAAWLRSVWRTWGSIVLVALSCVLVLAIAFAVSARAVERADQLNAQLADAERRASAVTGLVRTMAAMHDQARYIAARKARSSLIATLASLTEALPDGTWLTDIQFDGDKLHIQGYSRAAADLVVKLDRSGHFANAQFTAPLVRNDADGTDRFELTAIATGSR
jgi:general secretion pathway protein L